MLPKVRWTVLTLEQVLSDSGIAIENDVP